MNTIATPATSYPRIRGRMSQRSKLIVSLATGLALAGSLALGFSGSLGNGSVAKAPARASFAGLSSSYVPTTVTFYVVANEDQAERARYYEATLEAERAVAQTPSGYRSSIVLMADTPEASTRAQHFIDSEVSASSPSALPSTTFQVVDLR